MTRNREMGNRETGNRSYEAGDWRRRQETEYGRPESLRQGDGIQEKEETGDRRGFSVLIEKYLRNFTFQ